jgi:beta-glucosidase
VRQGLLEEADLDRALRRLFAARMRLGMFDPPERVPYASIPYAVNDCDAHKQLAMQAARECIVLLKNADGFLPLDKASIKTIAVVGPNADDPLVLLGNYNGTPSRSWTPRQGIQEALPGARVLYARGSGIANPSKAGFAAAVDAARQADVVIACMGLSQQMEGEEGQEEGVEVGERSFGDRVSIDLPGAQEELLKELHATGKPVVLVLLNGSAVAVNWADANLPAIIEAWYPGQAGGIALAEVLFGDYNPAGRLPVTFYKSASDLPSFEDYRMEGRTYRYFRGQPLYAFGHGLSYTSFAYSNLRLSATRLAAGQGLEASVEVTNTGARSGDEVAQLYLVDAEGTTPRPIRNLAGFQRVHFQPGETRRLSFAIAADQMAMVNAAGQWVVEPGEFVVEAGGNQTDTLKAAFTVTAQS